MSVQYVLTAAARRPIRIFQREVVMRNIERACARFVKVGRERAARALPFGLAEAEHFVARVLLEEGVRPWPPYEPNGEVQFYARQLVLDSYRPRRVRVNKS